MVCEPDGQLLAPTHPPMLDAPTIERAAAALGERTAALQTTLGPVGTIDLRYASSRIIVKALGNVRVLFLCSPSINLQLLAMSTSGIRRQMEKVEAGGPRAEPGRP